MAKRFEKGLIRVPGKRNNSRGMQDRDYVEEVRRTLFRIRFLKEQQEIEDCIMFCHDLIANIQKPSAFNRADELINRELEKIYAQ